MASGQPNVLAGKVAQLCAADQADDIRQYIPVAVSPDQSVCLDSNRQIVPLFISGFRHSGGSFLHVCAHFGSSQAASYLLRHGASPNLLDKVCLFGTESSSFFRHVPFALREPLCRLQHGRAIRQLLSVFCGQEPIPTLRRNAFFRHPKRPLFV
jgi:hypothetical protein